MLKGPSRFFLCLAVLLFIFPYRKAFSTIQWLGGPEVHTLIGLLGCQAHEDAIVQKILHDKADACAFVCAESFGKEKLLRNNRLLATPSDILLQLKKIEPLSIVRQASLLEIATFLRARVSYPLSGKQEQLFDVLKLKITEKATYHIDELFDVMMLLDLILQNQNIPSSHPEKIQEFFPFLSLIHNSLLPFVSTWQDYREQSVPQIIFLEFLHVIMHGLPQVTDAALCTVFFTLLWMCFIMQEEALTFIGKAFGSGDSFALITQTLKHRRVWCFCKNALLSERLIYSARVIKLASERLSNEGREHVPCFYTGMGSGYCMNDIIILLGLQAIGFDNITAFLIDPIYDDEVVVRDVERFMRLFEVLERYRIPKKLIPSCEKYVGQVTQLPYHYVFTMIDVPDAKYVSCYGDAQKQFQDIITRSLIDQKFGCASELNFHCMWEYVIDQSGVSVRLGSEL